MASSDLSLNIHSILSVINLVWIIDLSGTPTIYCKCLAVTSASTFTASSVSSTVFESLISVQLLPYKWLAVTLASTFTTLLVLPAKLESLISLQLLLYKWLAVTWQWPWSQHSQHSGSRIFHKYPSSYRKSKTQYILHIANNSSMPIKWRLLQLL